MEAADQLGCVSVAVCDRLMELWTKVPIGKDESRDDPNATCLTFFEKGGGRGREVGAEDQGGCRPV
jgi:hypothetical protein